MARSSTILGGPTIGGLGGEIPTSELPSARRAFLDYLENFTGNEDEKLDFTAFVRQKWKKSKSN